MRAAIVGAGIFGCVVGRALQRAGWEVNWYDDRRPLSGSAPSACLMKPSWFSGMGERARPALEMLDRLYGLREVALEVWPTRARAKAHWVPCEEILESANSVNHVTVTRVGREGVWYEAQGQEHCARADLVVVAAGVWCDKLLLMNGLYGRTGVSFRWWYDKLPEGGSPLLEYGKVMPWAPYKQVVGFNEGPMRVWGGDGSAIKPENWTAKREGECLARVSKFLGLDPAIAVSRTGIRPFYKTSDPCLLDQMSPSTWLATGGGKNGTIAAGWAAHELLRRLG